MKEEMVFNLYSTKGKAMKRWNLMAVVLALGLSFCLCGCEDDNDPAPAAPANISGTWVTTITYTEGYVETWVDVLTQTGSAVTGTSTGTDAGKGSAPLTGTVSGTSVSLVADWGDGETYIYTGVINSPTSMSGTSAYSDGSDSGVWQAVKQ